MRYFDSLSNFFVAMMFGEYFYFPHRNGFPLPFWLFFLPHCFEKLLLVMMMFEANWF